MMNARAKNMILGAYVADAAAMGLHWIYDQDHLAKIASVAPAFRDPDPKVYDGVPAFFAHPTRRAGDPSQYGEQLHVMLRTLVAGGGQYEPQAFAKAFRTHFGYGGAYVGYIDHATRDTLDNFRRAEDAALAAARTLPFDGDAKVTKSLVARAIDLRGRFEGAALRDAFQAVLLADHKDEAVVAYGISVLEAISSQPQAGGAKDKQLPALPKLPPLVAVLAERDIFKEAVASAVKTTSDHQMSADYGQVCAAMMRAALQADDMAAIVQAGRLVASAEADTLLAQAVGLTGADNVAVTKQFGMACDLDFGVPSAVHNVLTASSFREAVERNILAGGDSCGRSILVGALMGAVHGVGGEAGVPAEWVEKLSQGDAILADLDLLLG